MLVRFNKEILKQGPDATLPANLPPEWLDVLADEAESYLAGRTNQSYFCLALVASRELVRSGDELGPTAYELDQFVRRYALDLLSEKAARALLSVAPLPEAAQSR